jgi:hypothetical protein
MCHRAQMRRYNFAELRQCEVRGKPFPRTRVNSPSAALPRPEALIPSEAKAQPSRSPLAAFSQPSSAVSLWSRGDDSREV